MFELTVKLGDRLVQKFRGHTEVNIGRDPGCELMLDNLGVSRRHAQLREGEGKFIVEDLKVDQRRVRARPPRYFCGGQSRRRDQDRQIFLGAATSGRATNLAPVPLSTSIRRSPWTAWLCLRNLWRHRVLPPRCRAACSTRSTAIGFVRPLRRIRSSTRAKAKPVRRGRDPAERVCRSRGSSSPDRRIERPSAHVFRRLIGKLTPEPHYDGDVVAFFTRRECVHAKACLYRDWNGGRHRCRDGHLAFQRW